MGRKTDSKSGNKGQEDILAIQQDQEQARQVRMPGQQQFNSQEDASYETRRQLAALQKRLYAASKSNSKGPEFSRVRDMLAKIEKAQEIGGPDWVVSSVKVCALLAVLLEEEQQGSKQQRSKAPGTNAEVQHEQQEMDKMLNAAQQDLQAMG